MAKARQPAVPAPVRKAHSNTVWRCSAWAAVGVALVACALAFQLLAPVAQPVVATSRSWAELGAWNGTFELEDAQCRIWSSPAFLSASEVDHVLNLVQRAGGWGPSATGGQTFQVPLTLRSGRWEDLVRGDEVIRAIEARIANVTGIEPHPLEDMVTLARMMPIPGHPRHGYTVPWGLHHETDTRPHRTRTIIVYLNDVPEGGRTIFPLCGAPPTAPDRIERHNSFQAGLDSMLGGLEGGFRRHVDFDVHRTHPFNGLLEEACRGNYGFSMAPRKGAALLFDSMLPSGEYNRWTWHAGCNVVQGEKLLLQKFKELPAARRRDLGTFVQPTPYHPYLVT